MPAAFKFRLAPLLKLRRLALREQQRRVAATQRTVQRIERQCTGLHGQIDDQISAARSRLSPGAMVVEQVIWDRHQLIFLRKLFFDAAATLEQHRAVLAGDRQKLSDVYRGVRTLERLEETRREAFESERRRTERRDLDELGMLTHSHRRLA